MSAKGNELRFYRLQKGLTLEEAAKELGISRQTLQKYEQSSINIPITIFIKMAKLYDIDSFTLFGVEDFQVSDFECDISPYYLLKLYAQLKVKSEMKEDALSPFSKTNDTYYINYFRATVKKYISTISYFKPELREEFEREFANDMDFEIN